MSIETDITQRITLPVPPMPRALRRGMVGEDVRELDRLLIACGAQGLGRPDPVFGSGLHAAVVWYQQTYLGPDGEPLTVDGWVGDDTWWSLHQPPSAQRSGHSTGYVIPAGLGPQRTQILEVALAEYRLDVVERPFGSNRGDRIDVYTHFQGVPANAAGPKWCCFFVSWVLHEAMGLYPLAARVGSCMRSYRLAEEQGRYVLATDPGLVIVPGDIFVQLYVDDDGEFVGTGHTGLVSAVSADGKRINTIEGNAGNRVKFGVRNVSTLHGIWRPCDLGALPMGFERRIFKAGSLAAVATT